MRSVNFSRLMPAPEQESASNPLPPASSPAHQSGSATGSRADHHSWRSSSPASNTFRQLAAPSSCRRRTHDISCQPRSLLRRLLELTSSLLLRLDTLLLRLLLPLLELRLGRSPAGRRERQEREQEGGSVSGKEGRALTLLQLRLQGRRWLPYRCGGERPWQGAP